MLSTVKYNLCMLNLSLDHYIKDVMGVVLDTSALRGAGHP